MTTTLAQISGGYVFRQELVKDSSYYYNLQTQLGYHNFLQRLYSSPRHQTTQYLNMGHMEAFPLHVGDKGHQSLPQESASE